MVYLYLLSVLAPRVWGQFQTGSQGCELIEVKPTERADVIWTLDFLGIVPQGNGTKMQILRLLLLT